MRTGLPLFIYGWFALDLLLALLPPVHWWAGRADPFLGMPRGLIYIYGLDACIAASVIAAYLCDRRREG